MGDTVWAIQAEREIASANILLVRIRTTGPCGGDAGHGCCTEVEFVDEAGTCWSVDVVHEGSDSDGPRSVKLRLEGDTELETFARALRFAADMLDLARNDR